MQYVCTLTGTSYIVVDNSTGLPTIRDGYPRPLSAEWPSLGGVERLDAALYVDAASDDTSHLYLFGVMYQRINPSYGPPPWRQP